MPRSERAVRTEDVQIPMPDGVRLHARVWWPEMLPAPTVLEQLPYRLTDFRSDRDDRWFRRFAESGYVGLRVDVRGTGNSEGRFEDEYSSAERDDAVSVVEWIAEQSWSDGSVGAIGISYSGFGALQLASRRPRALKAIMAAGFADDRFSQDVHRVGGALHDMGLFWSQMLTAITALPPDPAHAGDAWREQWLERLAGQNAPLATWLEHQERDDFWRAGSAIEHYEGMTCPVYAVSGWADRYPDGVLSLLSNYPGPHKALIGPWEHAWPHEAGRGARLDFESEAVRWFDHWLRGIDTGIMDEPRATVWMQEGSERPDPESGRWVSAHEWPPTRPQMLYLSSHTLTAAAQPLSDDVVIDTPVTVGTSGGVSAPLLPGEADQPGDQAPDDDRSVLFDSEPLVEPLDLLGRLRLGVRVTSDRPFGTLAARVTHVSPSGASTLIATGVLSLPLAGDPGASLALEPNQPVHAVVDFLGTGYRVPAGHRLRLALSSGYWPWAWPAPGPFRLTIPRGETPWLELPVLTDAARRSTIPLLDRFVPAVDRGTWVELARLSGNSRTYVTGPDDGEIARRSTVSLSGVPLSGGARFQFDIEETIGLREADPTSASYRSTLRAELERADWHPRVRVECSLAGGKESFELRMELHAQEEDSAVDVTRVWETSIPRALL